MQPMTNHFFIYNPNYNGRKVLDWCTEQSFISTVLGAPHRVFEDKEVLVCEYDMGYENLVDFEELHDNRDEPLVLNLMALPKGKRHERDLEDFIVETSNYQEILDFKDKTHNAGIETVYSAVIPKSRMKLLIDIVTDPLLVELRKHYESFDKNEYKLFTKRIAFNRELDRFDLID